MNRCSVMESEGVESLGNQSDSLRGLLHQEGFRLTVQRQKIIAVFQQATAGHHLSAEEIYQTLSEQGEKIGISTIYRALHLLVKLGLLRELTLSEDRKFYELSTPFLQDHHHLVCVQCGAVREFQEPLITQVGGKEARDRGFSLLNCDFVLYVLCPSCVDTE